MTPKQRAKVIEQEYYLDIEIDNTEADIVILWNNGEAVMIERQNIPTLINLLAAEIADDNTK